MRSHRLRVFERTAVAEIGRDAGRPKRMIAERAKIPAAAARRHHAPGVGLRHRLLRQHGGVVPRAGAEQPGPGDTAAYRLSRATAGHPFWVLAKVCTGACLAGASRHDRRRPGDVITAE
jgi:hypothetical protein